MLRSLLSASRVAGGAAVAAAATPDASHARALQPRSVLPARKEDELCRPATSSDQMHVADADWILAHLQNGNVWCEEDDVESVFDEMLAQSSRAAVVDMPPSESGIEDDDRSFCTSVGASADEHIEQADRQAIAAMQPVLMKLLNDEGVQKSVFAAIGEDESLAHFLQNAQGPSRLLLEPSTVVIEEVAETEVQSEAAVQSSPFHGALGKVGAGLIRLGEDLKGAGEHLGGVFVGLGHKLQGSIIGAHAHTKKAVQEPSNHKDFWMNALGVVAVAVLTVLFAKGKLRVRTA